MPPSDTIRAPCGPSAPFLGLAAIYPPVSLLRQDWLDFLFRGCGERGAVRPHTLGGLPRRWEAGLRKRCVVWGPTEQTGINAVLQSS